MATLTDEEPPQTTVERLRQAVTAPLTRSRRVVAFLSLSAGFSALAPVPFNVFAVMALVGVAMEWKR